MGVKRVCAAVLLLAFHSSTAGGEGFRVPVSLGELIGTADGVVVGTIASVSDCSFTLVVEQTLVGEIEETTIGVEKFRSPTTTPRWAEYEDGQRVLLFLARTELPPGQQGSPGWRILGRIGEGEIALEEGYAYFHGRYIDSLPQDHYRFQGQTSYLQRLDRESTLDAVRTYRECFRWFGTPSEERRPMIVCSPDALTAYGGRSPLHEFLVKEAREADSSPSEEPRQRQ